MLNKCRVLPPSSHSLFIHLDRKHPPRKSECLSVVSCPSSYCCRGWEGRCLGLGSLRELWGKAEASRAELCGEERETLQAGVGSAGDQGKWGVVNVGANDSMSCLRSAVRD